MKKYLALIVVLLQSGLLFSQNDFPDSWVGDYAGELEIYGVDAIKMKVQMKLEVQPKSDSIYTWHLIYKFNGNEDKRMYELQIIDAEKGHYMIDEKNTILIDGYYRMGIFTSFFEVQESFIISTYKKKDDDLIFEIIAATRKDATLSGDQEHDGNPIPKVVTYPVNGRQKAVLRKIISAESD